MVDSQTHDSQNVQIKDFTSIGGSKRKIEGYSSLVTPGKFYSLTEISVGARGYCTAYI